MITVLRSCFQLSVIRLPKTIITLVLMYWHTWYRSISVWLTNFSFKYHFSAANSTLIGRDPYLVVMVGDLCWEGHGFESRRRILDGHNIFSHILVVRIVMFVWKDENKRKRDRGCPLLKKDQSIELEVVPIAHLLGDVDALLSGLEEGDQLGHLLADPLRLQVARLFRHLGICVIKFTNLNMTILLHWSYTSGHGAL